MKKFLFICLATCLGLVGCEKDKDIGGDGAAMMPPGYGNNSFCFIICDAEGNSVFDRDNFDMNEVTLEYEGKTFKPIPDVHQKIDENDPDIAHWCNSIIFEPYPNEVGPVFWRIWGHKERGEAARYIIRYKDNEWVVDYLMEAGFCGGREPESEAVVNGEKIEKILIYTYEDHPDYSSEEERQVWKYPLYVK